MSLEEKIVKIRIYGSEYSIRSEENSKRIKEVAKYVDEKMHEIDKNVRVDSSLKIAILTCINITGEFFSERQKTKELREKLQNKINKLNSILDDKIRH